MNGNGEMEREGGEEKGGNEINGMGREGEITEEERRREKGEERR